MKGLLPKRPRRKKRRNSEAPPQADELVAQISHYLKRRDAGYWPPARRAYASERFKILDKPKKDKFLITSSIPTCPAKLFAMAGEAKSSIQYLFAHGTMFDIKTRPKF